MILSAAFRTALPGELLRDSSVLCCILRGATGRAAGLMYTQESEKISLLHACHWRCPQLAGVLAQLARAVQAARSAERPRWSLDMAFAAAAASLPASFQLLLQSLFFSFFYAVAGKLLSTAAAPSQSPGHRSGCSFPYPFLSLGMQVFCLTVRVDGGSVSCSNNLPDYLP